ncbi:TPA: transcriptional repressor, partial [Enterococcus faecium]|nr:transcriptional repressor [Enterococcus faecium]
EEVEEDLLLEVEQVVEERYHFLVKDHRLTFHGICQECYEKEKRNQSV